MSIIKNYLMQNKVTHTFSSCQWPIGDPQEKDFHFCDATNVDGKPYCQQLCYFCTCHMAITSEYSKVKDYMNLLFKEIDAFSSFVDAIIKVKLNVKT